MLQFKQTKIAYETKLQITNLEDNQEEIEIVVNTENASTILSALKIEKEINYGELLFDKKVYDNLKTILDEFNYNELIQTVLADFLVTVGKKRQNLLNTVISDRHTNEKT